ncbi:MAG: hemolysin III family protein [Acidimicrobiales bacterium]|jgi:hemolysin III
MNFPAPKPLFRGVSHRAAFISALTLAPLMIVKAPGVGPRFIIALYSLSVVALFGVSALYHRIDWSPSKKTLMQKIDHITIFVAIAATYTPVAVFVLSPWAGTLVLWVVWLGATSGIIIYLRFPHAPNWAVALPYLVIGWSLLPVIVDAWRQLGVAAFLLLLLGGLLYTGGALIFAFQKPNPWPGTFGFHEVFHLCTIVGATLHYIAIAFFVLPKAA